MTQASAPSSPLAVALPPRPRRGSPEETRDRLVRAAAEVFNRDGFDGTDSNRLARAAGYAPGTFYKHFADKTEIFLAAYEDWVTEEWRDVAATLAAGGSAGERARRVVDTFVGHHRRWCGFRASLRALVFTDRRVRDAYRTQRRRQLAWLAGMSPKRGPARSREDDAMLLFTVERTADAMADGEAAALKLDPRVLRVRLIALIRARIASA